MTSYARVVVRLHWVELTIAVGAAVLMTAWIALVLVRTGSTSVPPNCFDRWVLAGAEGAGECIGPIRTWGSTLISEGTSISAAMAYLPYAIGLIAGVPIVASELEARTAATAWSLNPSRVAWLARSLGPIIGLVGLAAVALAITTSRLEADRVLWGYSGVEEFGRYGAPVAARVIGSMAVGLLAGALLGRTLPGLVLTLAVVVAIGYGLGVARAQWQASLAAEAITIATSNGELKVIPGAIVTGIAFESPSGIRLSLEDARTIAHDEGAPWPEAEDEQDLPAATWLEANGYRELSLGVTPDQALGWEIYELASWTLVAVVASAAAFVVVDRKRPA